MHVDAKPSNLSLVNDIQRKSRRAVVCEKNFNSSFGRIHNSETAIIASVEFGPNERCNFSPHGGVILDLDMRLHENSGKPRIAGTGNGVVSIG
jgi:hypothetical protein